MKIWLTIHHKNFFWSKLPLYMEHNSQHWFIHNIGPLPWMTLPSIPFSTFGRKKKHFLYIRSSHGLCKVEEYSYLEYSSQWTGIKTLRLLYLNILGNVTKRYFRQLSQKFCTHPKFLCFWRQKSLWNDHYYPLIMWFPHFLCP
jgi:hypothetical protein